MDTHNQDVMTNVRDHNYKYRRFGGRAFGRFHGPKPYGAIHLKRESKRKSYTINIWETFFVNIMSHRVL